MSKSLWHFASLSVSNLFHHATLYATLYNFQGFMVAFSILAIALHYISLCCLFIGVKLLVSVSSVWCVFTDRQLKSAALRGERYRVIGERGGPAGMWRLEGGKWGLSSSYPDITGRWYPADFGCFFFGFAHLRTIPKTHVKEGGWKWVESSETWRPTLGYNVWWLTISGLGRARAGGKVGEATACGHCPRTDFHT